MSETDPQNAAEAVPLQKPITGRLYVDRDPEEQRRDDEALERVSRERYARIRRAENAVTGVLGAKPGPFAFSELLRVYLAAGEDRDLIFIATARRLVSPGSYTTDSRDDFFANWGCWSTPPTHHDLAELTDLARQILAYIDHLGRRDGE